MDALNDAINAKEHTVKVSEKDTVRVALENLNQQDRYGFHIGTGTRIVEYFLKSVLVPVLFVSDTKPNFFVRFGFDLPCLTVTGTLKFK